MKKILHLLNKQAFVWCLFLISGVMWGQTAQALEYLMPNTANKAYLNEANGWAQTGIGTDYASSTGSIIKFDTSGDNATLFIASAPSKVIFNLKGNSLSGAYVFKVTESSDGATFVDAQTISSGISTSNTVFETPLLSTTRYIKWTYVTKVNGNIGFGGVNVKAPVISVPTLTNTTATNISTTAADFAGNVTATGGSAISANGTVYAVKATNANPQIGGSGVTNLATSSPAAGTGSFSNPSGAVLSPNVQYSYNAYATNTTGTGYGTVADFWTLANVPSAVSLSGAQVTSLSVSLNATDGNPATTEYAIQETGPTEGQYLQNDGTFAPTAVWHIAGALGWNSPVSVSGLTANTSYTFQVKARNGANVQTTFSTTTSLSTLPNSSPNLDVSTLTNFTPACLNTTSDAKSFTLSGSNLSGNVTVGALDGFSFSNTESGTYTSSLVLTPTGNALNTTVFVKFTPTAVQSYNGNISVSGGGATAINVSVTASGINTTATATTVTSYGILANSATAEGSLTAGCSIITQYGIEYSTTNNFVNGTGTKVASININAGNFTASLTGLLSSTTYYYKGYATNATETVYGTQSSFVTDALLAPVATAGTSVSHTGFTANWNAVVGATGYELDVYEKVLGTSPNLVQNSGFESGNLTSWTFESPMNEVISTTEAKSGTSSLYTSVIATKNFKQAISVEIATEYVLKFSYFIDNTATGNGFRVWTTVGTDIKLPSTSTFYNEKGSWVTVEHTFTTTGTSVELNFRLYNGVKIYFDDIQINKSQSSSVLNYVSGFENMNVGNVTSKNITNLDSETEYFYRVRATDGAASANSNEISVTTLVGTTTYTEGAWTNGTPTAVLDAIIDDNFTTTGDLSVKSLTINSGKVFTVATGTTLTIVNALTNNGGLTGFVVESDGVVLQNSTTANTALATVKRNSTSLFLNDYTLWSSPVFEPNLRAFSAQTLFNRFYSYDFSTAVAGAYKQEIINTNDVDTKKFISGKGYLIRMPNNANAVGTTAQSFQGLFKGNLNNGEIQIPLYGVVPSVSNGFNLVGNPYPSPIKISEFMAVNNGKINGTMYFWRKKASANDPTNQISGYATYNAGGMVSADAAIQGQTLTHIKPGQGFFVQAIGASPGNLVFNNGMREKASTLFFKSSPENSPELHRFWLNLSNETNVVGQTLVAYATDATEAVDSNYDALYFNDSPLALTSIINNNEYIIQGRSLPFLNTDVVSLGFKTDVAGSYTIALSNFDGLFTENQDIFLKDKSTNTLHNLKTASYSFTSPIGVFNDRFEIRYNSVLGTNNPILAANTILIGVKNQQIKINAGSVTMEKIELIDLSGRVLFTLSDVDASTATIENLYSSNQMLIVRISTKENGVVSQKIIF